MMMSVSTSGVMSLSPQHHHHHHDIQEDKYKDPRRPRKANFFINGDRYYKGKKFFVTPHRYFSFNDLLNELTGKLPSNLNLPYGVRQIYEKNGGQRITDAEDILDGESYVLAGFEGYKSIKYGNTDMEQWSMSKPVKNSNQELSGDPLHGNYKYRGYQNNAFAPGRYFRTNGSYATKRWPPGKLGNSAQNFATSESYAINSKPKVITVIRNGATPRNNIKILLNRRSVQSYEQLMSDISEAFTAKGRQSRVLKLYTIRGKAVQSVSDFFRNDDVFIGIGHEQFSHNEISVIIQDLYSDDIEVKSILKSWEKHQKRREAKERDVPPKTDKRDSGFGESSDASYRDSDSNINDLTNRHSKHNSVFSSPSKPSVQEAKMRRRQQKLRESEQRAIEEEKRKKGLIPLEPISDPYKAREEAKRCRKEESRRLKELVEEQKRQREQEERRRKLEEEEERLKAEKAARKRMEEIERLKRAELEANKKETIEMENKEDVEEETELKEREAETPKGKKESESEKADHIKDDIDNKEPQDTSEHNEDKEVEKSTVKEELAKTEITQKEHSDKQETEKTEDNSKDKENERPKRKSKVKVIRRTRIERQVSKEEHVTSKYELGRVLGDGNFAVVKQSKLRNTGQEFGIKVIDKSKLKGKEHMVENEIEIMKECNHVNIVKLYEEYETKERIYLVMELVKGGDLFDAITQSVKFNEVDASRMIRDLCSALFYLHSRNIVHRDLKPENLLVHRNKDGTICLKLADFGLAMEVQDLIYTVCGTPTYVAPEILSEIGYSLEVDMWAVGVIMYILLCGFPPFRSPDRNQTELFKLIKAGQYEFVSPYWDGTSTYAKNLIGHLLIVDRAKRYSSIDVSCHPWIMYNGSVKIFPDDGTIEKERRDKVREMEKEALINFESYQKAKEKRLRHHDG